MEGHVLIWEVTNADTAIAGSGTVELMGLADGKKKLSAIMKTYIRATTTGATTAPPDSARPWVDQVLEAAERAEAAAERAESAGGSGGAAGGIVAETDPTVYDWAKQPQKPTYTADEVNAIGKDALPQAIEAALAQAKENGEFDGAPGLKGDPGKDGGYYQPSVTNGMLTWTPSNANMPSVPSSDVRGPAGQDGQPGAPGKTAYQYAQDGGYTGTEAEFAEKLAEELPEPYTLPIATADRLGGMMVGKGLTADEVGRVSVEPEGECELIEEITLEEDISNFIRDVTPDGKPYNFRRLIVVVNKPAVLTSGYMWMTINGMEPSVPENRLSVVSTHDENERNSWCDLSIVAGKVRCVFVDTNQAKVTNIISVGTTKGAFMQVKATNINAIRYNYGNFPAGTKITIYGEWRRDNEKSV